jgi:hypothetical protein
MQLAAASRAPNMSTGKGVKGTLTMSQECKTNGEEAIHLNLYLPFAHRLQAVPNAAELGIVK